MKKHSWDDLQLILAITQGNGLSGASKILGVHHATVLRRLNTFEHRMGVILFDRCVTGYIPTETGEALAEKANLISKDVEQTYRSLEGEDLRLSGTIRIATTDFLAHILVPKILKIFCCEHPGINVEIIVSSHFASLSKREADVSLRAQENSVENKALSGSVVSSLKYAVYTHESLLSETKDLRALPWIGYDPSLVHSTLTKWQDMSYGTVHMPIVTNNMMSKFAAIKNGLGVGFLPQHLGNAEPGLVCLETSPDWVLNLWFLTHNDLYKMRRVQSLLAATVQAAKKL